MTARANIPLSDFIMLQRGFDLPTAQRKEGEVPVIASTGIASYHNEAKVRGPGVVIGRSGSIGGGQYIVNDFWPLNTTLWVKDFKGNNPRFTYYLLISIDFTRFNAGAGVPTLNRNHIASFRVPRFNPAEQARIASILSAYDDLIENNRGRIQLLEQAAQLLYREWFVYLRFPGHEHVTITDGVPDGWAEGVVADFYSTGSGGTPSRKDPDFYTGEIPWVKTQELTGGFILSTGERITDEAVKRSSAKLFPRHTVLIAMYGATIGQTAILSVPSTTNQACCAVIQKKPGTSYAHAYLFFRHYKTDLVGLGQGAAQNNVSQQVIKSFKMVLPRKELMEAFLESVSPLFEQVEILQKSNINLVQTRDLLLPRLMNGEVTV